MWYIFSLDLLDPEILIVRDVGIGEEGLAVFRRLSPGGIVATYVLETEPAKSLYLKGPVEYLPGVVAWREWRQLLKFLHIARRSEGEVACGLCGEEPLCEPDYAVMGCGDVVAVLLK